MAGLYGFELERDGLNRSLGEGFPKGIIGLTMGEYGSGKSAIMQRLCYGFLQNGVTVTYVSTELTTKGFIDQMKSLEYPSTCCRRTFCSFPSTPSSGRPCPATSSSTSSWRPSSSMTGTSSSSTPSRR